MTSATTARAEQPTVPWRRRADKFTRWLDRRESRVIERAWSTRRVRSVRVQVQCGAARHVRSGPYYYSPRVENTGPGPAPVTVHACSRKQLLHWRTFPARPGRQAGESSAPVRRVHGSRGTQHIRS
jgi:hypothetical protein